MNSIKILGGTLFLVGVLCLIYGGFSYTKDTTALKLGPIELSVEENKTVNIPIWIGAGVLLLGAILFFGAKKP